MSRFSFHMEWEEAPGVRDTVLARTWARLSIHLEEHIVTRALDLRANSERDGVYGPMFPLAEWLVENFWFITSEIPRSTSLSARHAPSALHPWMLRHNFLSAGAGAALPNLTLASDGSSSILAAWFPDRAEVSERRTIRFLGEGRVQLSVRDVETAIANFVNAVIVRLEGFRDEEVVRLRRDWLAISSSIREEETLCRQLAQLGLDPYGIEDDTVDGIETALGSVPTSLQGDLLDSEDLNSLAGSATYASAGARLVARGAGTVFRNPLKLTQEPSTRPHEIGYRLARAFRTAVGIPHDQGVPNLDTLMSQQAVTISLQAFAPSTGTRVKGVVGFSTSHAGVLVTPHPRSPAALRFLLGRALGACLLGQCDAGPRLLTEALTRDQAAARAFSAELLAPQAALAQRVRAIVSSDDVHELAQEFNVSEQLVAHQIENNRLATIVPD